MTQTDQRSDRDRVLDATDLVALISESVALRPKGREHVGLCPFHEDSSPSLSVVTHKANAFYKCFACGASGTAIDFMMNFHRMEFPEALKFLADRAGIVMQSRGAAPAKGDPASPDMVRRANDAALKFYRRMLADPTHGEAARNAISGRGISPTMVEAFQLGAAPAGGDHLLRQVEKLAEHSAGATDAATPTQVIRQSFEAAGLVRRGRDGLQDGFRNRVMFPICDELGRCIAFGARKINPDDEPKYLNSPESSVFHKSRSLYALHLAKRTIMQSGTAVIVEGYTDAIACHAAGICNVVATLGTALTRDHARVLSRLCTRVVLLFDGDDAGKRAAERAVDTIFSEPLDVAIATIPGGLDPDELLAQPDGAAQFKSVIDGAVDAMDHLTASFRDQLARASGAAARQRIVESMLARLSQIGIAQLPPLRRTMLLESISRSSGVPASLLAQLGPKSSASGISTATASGTHRPSENPIGSAAAISSLGSVRALPALGSSAGASALTSGSRARRIAERAFLALLIADPSLAGARLTLTDGAGQPVNEAFGPESFSGQVERALYSLVHSRMEDGESWSTHSLLAEIEDQDQRLALLEFFELGTRRLEGASAEELLSAAASDLDATIRGGTDPVSASVNDGTDSGAGATTESAAQARIESIRARGPRATAVPRRCPP